MKKTSTYIFNETKEVLCEESRGKSKKYKMYNNRDYIIYNKDDVVDTIAHYINTNRITKGQKVINTLCFHCQLTKASVCSIAD